MISNQQITNKKGNGKLRIHGRPPASFHLRNIKGGGSPSPSVGTPGSLSGTPKDFVGLRTKTAIPPGGFSNGISHSFLLFRLQKYKEKSK